MDESEIKAKYRSIKIKAGSLKKGTGKHKGKNTVVVTCSCSHSFVCATSDLWLRKCPKCDAKINKTRKTRKAAK
jgi:hypothetical protein